MTSTASQWVADKGRVTILDNGLNAVFGHSFTISKALHDYLTKLGVAHRIYACKDLEAAAAQHLDCVPFFELFLYETMPARPKFLKLRRRFGFRDPPFAWSEVETSKELNRSFAADLRRLPAETWAPDNLILIIGASQHQILGLAEFVRGLPAGSAKIVCQLMWRPTWLPWSAVSQLGGKTYRRAFRMLKGKIGRTIVFTTENEHMRDLYLLEFALDTRVLGIPLQGMPVRRGGAGQIRAGFFGYSSAEKGFPLLPEAIRLCRARRPDIEFTVQVYHGGDEPSVVAAERELRGMPHITLLSGSLSPEDYAAATSAADVVLLPYDPKLFGMRGSGQFAEAATSGRPVVASIGTWAGKSVEAGDAAGAAFQPYTATAFAGALVDLCDRMEEVGEAAEEKARRFAQNHSIESYVKELRTIADLAG